MAIHDAQAAKRLELALPEARSTTTFANSLDILIHRWQLKRTKDINFIL